MPAEKPRRLGRGLEALLAVRPQAGDAASDRESLRRIALADIRPNPFQPRKEFSVEELTELEASLRVNGLLQPITVRPRPSGPGYELIAGERRLRAASRLGWADIPAIVREIDDRTLLTLALVENLQRADLNPIEEAEGYQRLISEFTVTQQQVAEVVGKDRVTVSNLLRILKLPADIRKSLQSGQISLGHARALLALDNESDAIALAHEIVEYGLSVREVEQRSRVGKPASPPRARKSRRRGTAGKREADQSPTLRHATEQLRRRLQTDVSISQTGPERGAIAIVFYSADDLDRLLELILGSQREPM